MVTRWKPDSGTECASAGTAGRIWARPRGREGSAPEDTLSRQLPGLWRIHETDLPRSRGVLEIVGFPPFWELAWCSRQRRLIGT